MKILFLTIVKINSVKDRGIYTDLIRKFNENGHEMYIVSPNEIAGGKSTYIKEEMGVSLLKVKIGNLKKNNLLEKGINTLLIEPLFKKAIKKHFKDIKFDLVLYSTPPITFGSVISYIKKRDSAKTYLLLKDIFPQNAVDLKMMSEKSLIHKYFKKKEKQLYEISDYIGCMSYANVNYILKNNEFINKESVEINPNSIELKGSTSVDETDIYNKYDIPSNKVSFLYGGSLGKPQGIDFLIKCIKSNQNNSNIHFIIVGSGTEAKMINNFYNKEKPNNLTYIKFLPKEEYEKIVAVADVGMIFLDSKFSIPNFPSRLLSYMEASLPVLTATDQNTDIGDIVLDNEFGYKCISNDINEFNRQLPKFYDKKDRELMGSNAKKYLEHNYTVEHSYNIIMNHF